MIPLLAARAALRVDGLREPAERHPLLEAINRFRRRVDKQLPGMYVWFTDASLHITLRALLAP